MDRPAINGQLFAHGVLHGLETVNRLIEANLMTEVGTSDAAITRFASSVRVCPLFVGLGNSPDRPGTFHIGSGSAVVTAVMPLVYLLFSLAPQGLDLFQTVVKMHLLAGEGGLSDSITADPVVMLRALIPALLELLEAEAIYLEALSGEGA